MRLRRRSTNDEADVVIDLRERLAPYVDLEVEAAAESPDAPPEPLLTGLTRRVRPLRAAPYEPRHMAT